MDMDRRTLLRRTLGTGSLLLLAGCMGSKSDTGNSLSTSNVDFYGNDEGYLELSVLVTNAGNQPESGLLLVHAKLNGQSHERVRNVSLDAHETKEYTITYDVKMENVESFTPNVTIQEK